jgi:hypothetical protein
LAPTSKQLLALPSTNQDIIALEKTSANMENEN